MSERFSMGRSVRLSAFARSASARPRRSLDGGGQPDQGRLRAVRGGPAEAGRYYAVLHTAVAIAVLVLAAVPRGQTGDAASIAIDAANVENRISPRLYGQFAEFMFENIKFGMHAELLRNRGFEETANAIGLPRHWERHPDDRNDDAIRFAWDDAVAYPSSSAAGTKARLHSLRIDVSAGDGQARGFYQARVLRAAAVAGRPACEAGDHACRPWPRLGRPGVVDAGRCGR
jgi:hypothetical protein